MVHGDPDYAEHITLDRNHVNISRELCKYCHKWYNRLLSDWFSYRAFVENWKEIRDPVNYARILIRFRLIGQNMVKRICRGS
jgi:hypothetical protein